MFPAQNDVIDSGYPLFIWSAHPDATAYRLTVKRKGAKTPRLNKRLDTAQICVDGLCAVDSALFVDAKALLSDKTYRWWVTAIAADSRQSSRKKLFNVRVEQPTILLPTETPYGQPPISNASNGLDAPQSFLPTIEVAANSIHAIRTAVALSNNDCNHNYVIHLASGQLYSMSNPAPGVSFPHGASAIQPIQCAVTIKGHNAILARSSDPSVPTFRILSVAENGFLRIEEVTIQNGRANAVGGGGIHNDRGVLEVYRSTISDNRVTNNTPTSLQTLGGGIYSFYGRLSVEESVIINNRAVNLVSDGGGIGVIASNDDYVVYISGSDIRNNRASRYGNGIAIHDMEVNGRDNCFAGNYNPSPGSSTSNISVETHGLHNDIDTTGSWWGSSSGPLVNQSASTTHDSIQGNVTYVPFDAALPTQCNRYATPTPAATPTPTPPPYRINIIDDVTRSWSQFELDSINTGVAEIGKAFDYLSTTATTPQDAFNRVMTTMLSGSGTEILFIRIDKPGNATVSILNYTYLYGTTAGQTALAINYFNPPIPNGYCKAYDQGTVAGMIKPAAIICNGNLIDNYSGTTRTLQASQYTIVHEMGHIFDYRSTLSSYIDPLFGTFTLFDCNDERIMEDIQSLPWERGRRGWGTGPQYYVDQQAGVVRPLVTDFQQNVENIAVEAAADSFLNWLYRLNSTNGNAAVDSCAQTPLPAYDDWNGPGYLNLQWSATPHPDFVPNSLGIAGNQDDSLPGDARYFDLDVRIRAITQNKGW